MKKIVFILGLLLTGCPPVCEVAATRCAPHDIVEVCDAHGHWRTVADCGEVAMHSGGEWSCGTAIESGSEVSACLPEQQP